MYVIDGQKVPVIFPNHVNHVDVAQRLNRVMSAEGRRSAPVDSAGFISGLMITGTHGESESLGGLKSRGDIDRKVINEMPYCAGREGGLDIEAMMIEAVIRQLGPAFIGSAEAFSNKLKKKDKDPDRRVNGRCRECNAPRHHHHRTGCSHES